MSVGLTLRAPDRGALISMIDAVLFGALGFLLGCLLALMLAPPLWNRAVKLTTRRLEATMPMTLNDIQADKDQLRAEFAIELRKLEVALDKARDKVARELIETNKRRAEIAVLNVDLTSVRGRLQENESANRVLQQTIKRRLPDLDSRLKAAKKALADLESINAELRITIASQSDALKTARGTLHSQRTDIDRLRTALESGSATTFRGLGKPDARTLAENQRLSAELSKTQEELARAKTGSEENSLLRRELSRLASQILAVAHGEGFVPVPEPQAVVEVAEVYIQQETSEEPALEQQAIEQVQALPSPEQTWQRTQNGNGAEPAIDEAAAGNGAMHESAENPPEDNVDSIAAAMSRGTQHDEDAEDQSEDEANSTREEPRSFARRFVARREARRARKSGGTSLRDRLRGLVVEQPET
jgi:hypothetical protein